MDECQELFSVDVNDVIDESGKVVAIKNPAILKELKVARSSGKPLQSMMYCTNTTKTRNQ